MQIQKIAGYSANHGADGSSETFEMLLRAQSGVIPLAAIGKGKLDKNEAALFLSRELLFLRSVAESANLSMLAILLDELHESLLHSAKTNVKV